ncbi:MAG: hypothetical protein QOE70_1165 [Chthoniobacter sp.]|jgi:hypothetical protein|nr:hypothetical protein [Chthoniobacter sp.]
MRHSEKDTARFPLGTIMMYGPNASRATKYAATVIAAPDSAPVAVKRWFVHQGDIRRDRSVAEEISAFFKAHRVSRTVISEFISGCPHEEGVDYPLGSVCPDCPFWAETDRFSHEPKSPMVGPVLGGHITADEIVVALSEIRGCPPKAAFASADVRRAELTDRLIAAVEAAVANAGHASEEEKHLCTHALHLLAKWREPRAFPVVLRWLSLPGGGAFDLAGHVPTQAGSRLLASVCGGDRPEIRALIENGDANEYCRGQALESLAVLSAWGELPREIVVAYLRELIVEKLERKPSHVWSTVACLIADLDAEELVPLIRQPYDDEWVDPLVISWEEIENRTGPSGGPPFEHFTECHPPITDVASETDWWAIYDRSAPPAPRIADPKIGRNDQCPCGSGRKYKKCCGKNA